MWLSNLASLARGLAEAVFPNACLICDVPAADRDDFRHGLCIECYSSVTTDPHLACVRCAVTVGPHTDTANGCAKCRGESLGFDTAVRLGPYEGRLRDAVLRMKSSSGEALAEMMGRVYKQTANDSLRKEGVDAIVPIPLHWRREWSRGYNQSLAAARAIAMGMGVGFEPRLLRRVRHTPQQVQSSAHARRENVRGAFRVRWNASLSGKRILLVDDVMTTGSTAGEAARTLKGAGAETVVVAILARR